MKKIKKILVAMLSISVIFACFASISVNAAVTYPINAKIASDTNIYSLPGTTNHETAENKGQSQFLCRLTKGTEVIALGVELDGDGDKWYKINYGNNWENTGYAYINRVSLKYSFPFDQDFEANLLNFPESYHTALRALHAKYPNWKFVANSFDLSFNQAVETQYGVSDITQTRKWVEFSYGGNEWRDMRGYNASTDSWTALETRWTYASRQAIEYFMDPRNSLNENKIFAFMQQSYQPDTQTQDNLRTIIKGTFLENGYDKNGDGVNDKDAYIEDLIAAADESGVSPYVLAATIIVEQGINGTSNLISGTYSGFEGYYNFFNFSATGSTIDEISVSGLTYAKQNGWNSRTASIIGGAIKYADGYISIGQDTYYFKDFFVIKEDWNHQYASALYDAWTNAAYLHKGCIGNSDALITFSIPVFSDMPDTVCPKPSSAIQTEVYADRLIITPRITGVYNFEGKNNNEITVIDSKQNIINYNSLKHGWPLVMGQKYTVKLKNYAGDYSDIDWNISVAADTIFPDTITNVWYNDAVMYAAGRGIISGYSNGNFGPADNIQRQDFLVILARYDGVDLSQYDVDSTFNDVTAGAYYASAVAWGLDKDITTGYSDGSGNFGVGDTMTREQLVTFLCRYADYKGIDISYSQSTQQTVSSNYNDYGEISGWANDSILWAIEKGVISGKNETTIAPVGNAQRCEVAQIMYNIYKNNVL